MRRVQVLMVILFMGSLLWPAVPPAGAARIKDLAQVAGVRSNQLVGYGLVVGLDGTGDGKQAVFTGQSLRNVLRNMGIAVSGQELNVKNVASVMITAELPSFAKVGQKIDVVLSSLGDASSLKGGTLIPTPLKGLDGRVYALAQGPVSIGGFEVPGQTAGRQRNHLTVARIPNGATVEREVGLTLAGRDSFSFTLARPDFTTARRMARVINDFLGGPFARAMDGGTVEVRVPDSYRNDEVGLLADLESLDVAPDGVARVVLDERTGTVVMGEEVSVAPVALAHGDLSLQVGKLPAEVRDQAGTEGGRLVKVVGSATLGEVVRALNAMGVAPRDLIAILQAVKAAGALHADLEIM